MQSSRLGKYAVFYRNSEEYHRIKREVWGTNLYFVELEKKKPVILDIGAHIGITTLYFKKVYQGATIVAVEPLPDNLELLKKNLFENQIDDVEVYPEAVTERGGEVVLYKDTPGDWYSTTSVHRGGWTGDQGSTEIIVPSRRLSDYLEKYQPDLVKIDIEGAEEGVLLSAGSSLQIAHEYLVEFHPVGGRGMGEIVKLFRDCGYHVEVEKDGRIMDWQRVLGLALIHASRV